MIKKVLYIIFLIIFCISMIYIVTYLYMQHKDEKDIKEIQNLMNLDNTETVETVSEIAENEDISPQKDIKILNFQNIQKENSNIVAWIKIEDTNINYPVLQGKDNNYYLYKNYKDEYSRNGSIFLDYNCNLEKYNMNYLIYGHNNNNGMMFSELIKYQDKDFFNSHTKINLITSTENSTYNIISVFKSQIYSKTDEEVFKYYNYIDLSNEVLFYDYINNCKSQSLYNIAYNPEYGDKILTLSTCEYSKANGRLVIVAAKEK